MTGRQLPFAAEKDSRQFAHELMLLLIKEYDARIRRHPTQKPIRWGLNLFGDGRFARNPHFDLAGAEREYPAGNVSPHSKIGKVVRLKSSSIWAEYRAVRDDPSARRLLNLLDEIYREVGDDYRTNRQLHYTCS